MSLEEQARQANAAAASPPPAPTAEYATLDDYPGARELLEIFEKYRLPRVGLYREERRSKTLFGSQVVHYALETHGWILVAYEGYDIEVADLIITEDGRLYFGSDHVSWNHGPKASGARKSDWYTHRHYQSTDLYLWPLDEARRVTREQATAVPDGALVDWAQYAISHGPDGQAIAPIRTRYSD